MSKVWNFDYADKKIINNDFDNKLKEAFITNDCPKNYQ